MPTVTASLPPAWIAHSRRECCSQYPAHTCNRGYLRSTFIFAKPADLGNTRPQKRESTNPRSETRAASAKRRPTAKPTRPRLTEEEKRELRRIRASENRQRRKERGLCKDAQTKQSKAKPVAQIESRHTDGRGSPSANRRQKIHLRDVRPQQRVNCPTHNGEPDSNTFANEPAGTASVTTGSSCNDFATPACPSEMR